MQSKFGLKDFVILVVLVAVGVSVWLAMVQEDRRWLQVRAIDERVQQQETTLARLERTSEESGEALTGLELVGDSLSEFSARLDELAAAQSRPVEMLGALSAQLEAIRQATGESQAALQARIEELQRQGAALSAGGEGDGGAQPGTSGRARDESWARPGVPIQWQPKWEYATDPRKDPNYRRGGEFSEIYEAQPAKITPSIQTDIYGRRIVDLVMESLAAYDPKTLKIRGLLAEAWQYDPQGMWLRARIRPEARFSDGMPVTAEDLRWSFHDYIMNPQIECERDRSILADCIERIEVIDEKSVEFTFKQPLFSNLTNALGIFIMPKHFYGKFEPSQINQSTGLLLGSAGFKLDRLDPDNQWRPPDPIVLVRNEQYWGPKPSLDRLRLRALDVELSRLTEFTNGLADMITPSAPQFVAKESDPGWSKDNFNLKWLNMRSGRAGIIWNCGPRGSPDGKLTPFHDQRVRQAMTLLLDREKMIRDIWKGVGEVCRGFSNTVILGDEIQAWPYDPARGKALLAEAGWTDRNGDRILENEAGQEFSFELTMFGGGEISERIALFIKDTYAAAGIRVTVRQMDWSVGDPVRQQRDFDAMVMGWGANAPESDPKQIFHSDSIDNQGDNFAQWNSPAADAAIDAARLELDESKRFALWRDFERALHEGQPYTWVRVSPYTRFVKRAIGNVNPYPRGLEAWEFFRGGPDAPGTPE